MWPQPYDDVLAVSPRSLRIEAIAGRYVVELQIMLIGVVEFWSQKRLIM